MARVTRIERPTDRYSGLLDYPPEYGDTPDDPIVLPDLPEADGGAAPVAPVAARTRAAVGDAWRICGAVAICFAITLLLNTKSLVKIAEAEPDGAGRTLLLTTARGLDAAASAVRLDRLNGWIDGALDRKDEAPRFDAVPTPLPAGDAATTAATPTDIALARNAAPPAPATPAAASVASPAQGTLPAPTAAAPALATPRPITTSNQLRVYVAGDSFVDWVGYDLADYGKKDGYITTLLDSKISSGLARPDYFDWPARIAQAMAGDPRPEAVVFFVGANDYTDLRVESGTLARGTPEWSAEYRKRAAAVMDTAGRGGAQFYWVGQPIMRDKARSKVAAEINAAVLAEATKRPWVHFIDTYAMFTDADGNYAAFLPGADGELVRVRQDEGIHLTRTGTTWVSEAVYKAIKRDWKIP